MSLDLGMCGRETIRSDWASTDDFVYKVNVTCVLNDNLPLFY